MAAEGSWPLRSRGVSLPHINVPIFEGDVEGLLSPGPKTHTAQKSDKIFRLKRSINLDVLHYDKKDNTSMAK